MRLRLEKRAEPSQLLRVVTPVAAVLLTMLLGAVVFSLLGYDGVGAVREIFLSPLVNSYKWQDLAVKAAPLVIIAVGLSIAYRANVWNIGAEGQYIVGAICGTGVGILTNDMTGWWIMPLMMLAGAAGGAAYAAVPAFLRVRFKVNEILTTLMLTYASVYLLNYLLAGPFKSPTSMGQPQTVMFSADQSLPYIIPGTIVQLNAPIAILVALAVWLMFSRSIFGFQIRVVGSAPHAARYGGFSADRTIWLAMLLSGGLAGFAGILEAMGPVGRLILQFPANYGFTAIIVAFLGRLHPLGAMLAGIMIAITFVGGEMAQITIKLPFAAVGIFQAMMLFLILASDILVRYRIRSVRPGEVPA
jgi:simple sugar transport system permease protein